MLETIKQTADYLKGRIGEIPNTTIILGTGLGELANEIEDKTDIPYTEIPNFLFQQLRVIAVNLLLALWEAKRFLQCKDAFTITKVIQ
jgi:purine-nucleoside phosphorylase